MSKNKPHYRNTSTEQPKLCHVPDNQASSNPKQAKDFIKAHRTALDKAPVAQAAHAGLLLSKYLCRYDKEGTSKAALIDAAQAAVPRSKDVYQQAYDRWEKALKAVYKEPLLLHRMVRSADRLAIGLGNASPLEVGLTLHHTYGVPFIPGSALKGLAAGYADTVWGEGNQSWKRGTEKQKGGEYYRFVFGDTDSAGCIDFLDAWIIVPSSLNASTLQPDVMTPHHSAYYEATNNTPASDWDSPVPVPFVTVNKGVCFSVYLGCAVQAKDGNGNLAKWLEVTADLLCDALKNWGIGGKTSAGYGRMVAFDKKHN